MTKVVSIVGMERCDTAYYLSEIYARLKRRTLVVDNSFSKDLFSGLHNPDEVIERGYVVYTSNLDYKEGILDEFDNIIFYEGLNPCKCNLLNSDKIFVFTDYSEAMARQIKNAFIREEIFQNDEEFICKEVFFILRDKTSKKISDKLVFSAFNNHAFKLAGVMEFDKEDYCKYINFSHNGHQTINGISEDFKEALVFMLMEMEGISRRTAQKILNKT